MQAPTKQLFKHTRDYQELKQSKANFILTKLINLFKNPGSHSMGEQPIRGWQVPVGAELRKRHLLHGERRPVPSPFFRSVTADINVRDHLICATVVYLIQAINKMHKGLTSHAIHNM